MGPRLISYGRVNGLPRQRSVAGLREWTAHLGLRHGQTPGEAAVGILAQMGGTLDAANAAWVKKHSVRKARVSREEKMTVPGQEAPAKLRASSRVIRRGQALSGFTG